MTTASPLPAGFGTVAGVDYFVARAASCHVPVAHGQWRHAGALGGGVGALVGEQRRARRRRGRWAAGERESAP
jgi:hypothetical protein